MTPHHDVVDLLERVWRSIDEVCSQLDAPQWSLPTDCPGWTVKDQVAHIAGTESRLLGRDAPDHVAPDMPHVRNPLGAFNEVEVDYRRPWPADRVLEEFRAATGARVRLMRSWTGAEFEAESWTPVGSGTVADQLGFRVHDCWVHEQDIRRAVGRPGHLEGPVAEFCTRRGAATLAFAVGKKVAPPDGTKVVFDVTGPVAVTTIVTMRGGRGRFDDDPAGADVRITMDLEAFTCLTNGRWTAERALQQQRVALAGDKVLGRRVLAEMNFML